MTPDRIEKAIQFLLEQQAAFEAALQKTREMFNESWDKMQAAFRETQTQIGETQTQIRATQTEIRETQTQIRETDAHIREVAKQTQINSDQIRLLKDACRDLLEHSGYTDFRLNRLENPEH